MNKDNNHEHSKAVGIYEELKNSGNYTFTMSLKEEKIFKKCCKSLNYMYMSMRVHGGFLHNLFKVISVPIIIFSISILNWYRTRSYGTIKTALSVYELSWHDLDFVDVKKKNDNEAYVHFFWLKKV